MKQSRSRSTRAIHRRKRTKEIQRRKQTQRRKRTKGIQRRKRTHQRSHRRKQTSKIHRRKQTRGKIVKSKSLLQEGGSSMTWYCPCDDDDMTDPVMFRSAPRPSLAPRFQVPQNHLRCGTIFKHNDLGAETRSKHRLVSGSGPRYDHEKCYEECDHKFLAARDPSDLDLEDLVNIGTDSSESSDEEDIKPAKQKNAKKKRRPRRWCGRRPPHND